MASRDDAEAVAGLVLDTGDFLDWFAAPEALVEEPNGEIAAALPADLHALYAEAADQIRGQVELALVTLAGDNPGFSMNLVFDILARAGWDGALRDFKLAVLDRSGRPEVRDATRGGRERVGGRIRRAVLGPFMGALNAALDSLSGIPGIAAIKELKDFLERVIGG
jgi:hypothetical protein